MPGYRKHLVGGACVYGITLYLLRSLNPSPFTCIEWLACALIGSLFPDIDIKSKGQNLFYSALLILFVGLMSMGHFKIIALLSCLCITPMLVHHRGLFHRPWFIISLPLGLVWIGCSWLPGCAQALLFDALFFIVGALSHVWLDVGLVRMFRW